MPSKIEEVVYCQQTEEQKREYNQLIKASRAELNAGAPVSGRVNNIVMQLRKMACHPLLHRTRYTDAQLKKMSKDILKEEQYWDSNQQYVFEDMQVMSDFELHNLCCLNKSLKRFQLPDEALFTAGKTKLLVDEILPQRKANGDRVLLFSQFTMMLDVLEAVLKHCGYRYLRLDGSTPVQERQTLIDQYYQDPEIFIFLLSTKAGGFGINLTPANYVILHDLDFNPFNDAQAEDRAYRLGQTRDVHVVKLITKGTIEEQIYQRAMSKLRLDSSLADAGAAEGDEQQVDLSTVMEMLKADIDEHDAVKEETVKEVKQEEDNKDE